MWEEGDSNQSMRAVDPDHSRKIGGLRKKRLKGYPKTPSAIVDSHRSREAEDKDDFRNFSKKLCLLYNLSILSILLLYRNDRENPECSLDPIGRTIKKMMVHTSYMFRMIQE